MKVLILEDEKSIRGFIKINLKREGYEVVEASTGEEALAIAGQAPEPDIAILDVMLPTISGLEVLEELRRKYPRMGIMMLTAKTEEKDKIKGLLGGADDYISKPFSPGELMARIKALLRRMKPEPTEEANVLRSGDIVLSLDERKLFKKDKEILVTPTEISILTLLIENAGKSLSRGEILNTVWGPDFMGELNIVDVNMSRIRQKIDADSETRRIETVWGFGYLWKKVDSDEKP